MKFLLTVSFVADPVVVEVEADSMREAWERRDELAATTKPARWTGSAVSVEDAS